MPLFSETVSCFRIAAGVLLCIAPVASTGCGDGARGDAAVVVDHDSTSVALENYPAGYDSLTSEVFSHEGTFLGLAGLAVSDSFVIAIERSGDPYVKLLSRETGRVVRTYGRRGDGPGEFRDTPVLLADAPITDDAWFFDLAAQQMTHLLFPTNINDSASLFKATSFTLKPVSIVGVAKIRDGFLASRYNPAGQMDLVRYDTAGVGGEVIMTPPLDDDRIAPNELSMAYLFVTCASPNGNRIGINYNFAGRVDMLDIAKKRIIKAAVPFIFQPTLTLNPAQRKLMFMVEGRSGYGSCVATDSHLFSIFRGTLRKLQEYSDPGNARATFIHIFQWDGKLARVIRLDHFAGSIALDASGKWLYSIAGDDEGFTTIRRTEIVMVQPKSYF